MNLRIEMDGADYELQLNSSGGESKYTLSGPVSHAGVASVHQISPGVYSILLGSKSWTVCVSEKAEQLEIVSSGRRHFAAVFDPRDRKAGKESAGQAGPVQIKALMPGKIIQILVNPGAQVEAGQGLIVVEAMKMQNEMKSPKTGTVSKIQVETGATVPAGAMLLVIE